MVRVRSVRVSRHSPVPRTRSRPRAVESLGLLKTKPDVIELAKTEDNYGRLRGPIWRWWLLWLLSCVASVFASITSGAQDAQGIANNTVAIIVADLVALVAAFATARLFGAFERKPVARPAHRWVVVADDTAAPAAAAGSALAVELSGEQPAA